ncbi:carboxypeptidase-like regulatory domain-containing protein [Patescibacteria group bacterium]|nr:carboxypeptidase-like regulatory domain-containing protein [Patescibacteria group bacterium]MCL5091225.1 carboxypeptidase-like regulatory domain-containing protein [Patescibacteria group bacterium]
MAKLKHLLNIGLMLGFFFSLFFYLPKQFTVSAGECGCSGDQVCTGTCSFQYGSLSPTCSQCSAPPQVQPTAEPTSPSGGGTSCDGCGSCENGKKYCSFPCNSGCCGGVYDCDSGGGGTSYVAVSGTIKNAATNAGIQGVSVYIVNSDGVNETVTTGADGKYTSSATKFSNTRDYAIRIPSLPAGYANPKTTATSAANSCIGGGGQPVGSSSYECQKISGGCSQSCNFTLDVTSSSSSSSAASRITCGMATAVGLVSQGIKTYGGKQYRQYWVVQGRDYSNALTIFSNINGVNRPTTLTYWRHPIGNANYPNDSCWYGKPNNTGECASEPVFPAATKTQANASSLTTNLDLTNLPSTQLGTNVVVCNATVPGQGACSGNPFGNYSATTSTQTCNTTETPADSRVMLNIVCSKKDEGNADCNGVVDDADYTRWKCEYSNDYHHCYSANSENSADFDGDGYAYLLDFEIWRSAKFDTL